MADFIPRAVTGTVLKDTPPEAAVIIGPRGCGKTTLLTEIVKHCPGEARWFNCDLPSVAQKIRFVSRGDAENFLRLAPTIVLEEVQRVPDIGLMLKILVDLNERREKPARLFVSASTSLVLAPGIQESAVGRLRERPIWPFSMAEIASHHYPGFVQDNLDTFLVYGSSPRAAKDFDAAADFLTDFSQGL